MNNIYAGVKDPGEQKTVFDMYRGAMKQALVRHPGPARRRPVEVIPVEALLKSHGRERSWLFAFTLLEQCGCRRLLCVDLRDSPSGIRTARGTARRRAAATTDVSAAGRHSANADCAARTGTAARSERRLALLRWDECSHPNKG
jgi:hypothetical protein